MCPPVSWKPCSLAVAPIFSHLPQRALHIISQVDSHDFSLSVRCGREAFHKGVTPYQAVENMKAKQENEGWSFEDAASMEAEMPELSRHWIQTDPKKPTEPSGQSEKEVADSNCHQWFTLMKLKASDKLAQIIKANHGSNQCIAAWRYKGGRRQSYTWNNYSVLFGLIGVLTCFRCQWRAQEGIRYDWSGYWRGHEPWEFGNLSRGKSVFPDLEKLIPGHENGEERWREGKKRGAEEKVSLCYVLGQLWPVMPRKSHRRW